MIGARIEFRQDWRLRKAAGGGVVKFSRAAVSTLID